MASAARLFFQQLEKSSQAPPSPVRSFARKRVKVSDSVNRISFVAPSAIDFEQSPVTKITSLTEINTPAIVVLGQSGGGKSSIINHLLGSVGKMNVIAPESASMHSCTTSIDIYEGHWFANSNDTRVTVIDTPGFFDTERRDSNFLAVLEQFMRNFPTGVLKVVIVTLPVTETRCASTYAKMIDQIGMLFGERVWEHTVFVKTLSNEFNPECKDELALKKSQWDDWLHRIGIENPGVIDFDYGIPESLKGIQAKFNQCVPFTPLTSEKIQLLLQGNPSLTPKEAINQVQNLRKMEADWRFQIQQQIKEIESKKNCLEKVQQLTENQQRRIQQANEKVAQLNQKLAAGPQIIYC